jgi:hypothetical protein
MSQYYEPKVTVEEGVHRALYPELARWSL